MSRSKPVTLGIVSNKPGRILLQAKIQLIFATLAYIVNCYGFGIKLIYNNTIYLIAIDEAHGISSCGNYFRPEYQKYLKIKRSVLFIMRSMTHSSCFSFLFFRKRFHCFCALLTSRLQRQNELNQFNNKRIVSLYIVLFIR